MAGSDAGARRVVRAAAVVVLGFGLALVLAACQPAAVTFSVTTTADGRDANPGDGVCEVTVGVGDCSLRAAIDEANAKTGTQDVHINLAAGTYQLTLAGVDDSNAAGDLDINVGSVVAVVIDGGGQAVVDGNGAEGVFHVRSGIVNPQSMGITGASGAGVRVASGAQADLHEASVHGNGGAGLVVEAGGKGSTVNSTVAGNAGGGVVVDGSFSSMLTTITDNVGGGIAGAATPGLTSTVVADQASGADCAHPATSKGYNLDSDGSCVLTDATDVTSQPADLLPLSGGAVPFAKPSGTSPAVNSVPSAVCAQVAAAATDQVGTTRPKGAACDSGAVEADFSTAPVAVDDTTTVGEDGPAADVDVVANDTDADAGDVRSVQSVDTTATAGSASVVAGKVRYSPNGAFESLPAGGTGSDTVGYTVADAFGDTDTGALTVTVTGVNDPPTAVADSASVAADSAGASVDVLGNDTDPDTGDTRVVDSVDTTGTSGAVTNNGSDVTYDPNGAFAALSQGQTATDTFTYTVKDGSGATSTATVTVTVTGVNHAPTATADSVTVGEDAAATATGVLGNDSDPDTGDTFSVVSVGTTGTVGQVLITGGGTDVTYDPNGQFNALAVGQSATDTFTYTIQDSHGATATATVTVTVTGANDQPTAVDDSTSVSEDAGATAITVLTNDTDPDSSDVLAVSSVTQPSLGVVTNNGSDVSFDPNGQFDSVRQGQTATATFTYTAQDNHGLVSTATVTVTVLGQNDGPSAVDDSVSVGEDDSATAIDVLGNDTDPDIGDTAEVTSVGALSGTLPGGGSCSGAGCGQVTFSPGVGNTVSYDPNGQLNSLRQGQTATVTFTYTMEDSAGASSTATVTVTVNGANDPPTAVDDADTTNEDTAKLVNVLGNDTDPDAGDTKEVTSVGTLSGTTPAGACAASACGTVTFAGGAGNNLTFNPNGKLDFMQVGQSATITFTYTMKDSAGATSTATVTMTVTGVNDAPVAVNDGTYAGVVGNTKAVLGTSSTGPLVTLTGNVLNQNDTDADTGDTKTASLVNANGANVTLNADGSFVFTPAPGAQNADVTFTYHVTDSQGAVSNTATVTLHVVERVWWVDNTLGANGTGTSTSPFNVLSSAAANDDAGDYVFLRGSGTYTGGIDLNASEKLFGEPNGLSVSGAATSPIVAANAGLTNPTVTNTTVSPFRGVGLANDVDIERVDLTSSTGDGAFGNAVTNVTIGSNTTLSGNGGSELKLSGAATGTVSVASTIANGSVGTGVDIENRSGGTVTLGGGITSSGGTAVNLVANTGGSVTFSGTVNSTGGTAVSGSASSGGSVTFSGSVTASGGPGINLSGNGGATFTFTGAVQLTTGSSAAFSATGGGTVTTSSSVSNKLTTTTGTALTVTATNIGSAGLTFESISSNGATRGILLDTTGTGAGNGSLTVTGNGGSCAGVGCTGGEIANSTGADDATTTPVGTGIVLKDTKSPSLTRMYIHDHSNYAIRGVNVAGFSLSSSIISGTNGGSTAASAGSPYRDSSVAFDELSGSATITGTSVSGGWADNFRVTNATANLNRITFTSVTIGSNSTTEGNDGIALEPQGTGIIKATVQNSVFTAARGDLFQYVDNGTVGNAEDLVFTGNALSNNHPAIATGGGGVTIDSSANGSLSVLMQGNTFRDAVGTAILFVKPTGPGSLTATIDNNDIGVAAVANSGSAEGDALKLQSVGQGTLTASVTNNRIHQYNVFGIEVLAGGGATAQSGTLNTTVTGNLIDTPGTTAGTLSLPKNGIHYNIGTVPGDTYQACANIKSNSISTAGKDAVPATGAGDNDFRMRQRQSTTIRLPGYGGANNDNAAVVSFIAGNNTGNGPAVGIVSNTVSSGGGGFTGGGSTCP